MVPVCLRSILVWKKLGNEHCISSSSAVSLVSGSDCVQFSSSIAGLDSWSPLWSWNGFLFLPVLNNTGVTCNFSFVLFLCQLPEEGYDQGMWIIVISTFTPIAKPPTRKKNHLSRAVFGGELVQILAHRLSPSCLSSCISSLWGLHFETSSNPSLPRWLWVYLDSPSRIFLIRYKGMNALL